MPGVSARCLERNCKLRSGSHSGSLAGTWTFVGNLSLLALDDWQMLVPYGQDGTDRYQKVGQQQRVLSKGTVLTVISCNLILNWRYTPEKEHLELLKHRGGRNMFFFPLIRGVVVTTIKVKAMKHDQAMFAMMLLCCVFRYVQNAYVF